MTARGATADVARSRTLARVAYLGADVTGDNCVTLQDYSRLRANYGLTGPLNAP